jgi:hypothetical protein
VVRRGLSAAPDAPLPDGVDRFFRQLAPLGHPVDENVVELADFLVELAQFLVGVGAVDRSLPARGDTLQVPVVTDLLNSSLTSALPEDADAAGDRQGLA